ADRKPRGTVSPGVRQEQLIKGLRAREVAQDNTKLREDAHGAKPDRIPLQASEVVRGHMVELVPRFSLTAEQAKDVRAHGSPCADFGMLLDQAPDGRYEPLQPAARSSQQVHLGGEAHGGVLRCRPLAR